MAYVRLWVPKKYKLASITFLLLQPVTCSVGWIATYSSGNKLQAVAVVNRTLLAAASHGSTSLREAVLAHANDLRCTAACILEVQGVEVGFVSELLEV
jgi:hypothetical protein